MAAPSLILFHTNNLSSPFPLSSPKRYKNQTLNENSFLNLKKQSLLPNLRVKNPRTKNPRSAPVVVFAAQSNFLKVVQTVWKVGKDGIETGTNLVPNSVPRPIARVAVTVVVLAVSLFLLKSFLSTVFFALATMGLVYFTFIALNKDQGPKGGGESDTVNVIFCLLGKAWTVFDSPGNRHMRVEEGKQLHGFIVKAGLHFFEFGYYSKLVRDKRKVQDNGVLWNVIIDTRMEDLIASRYSFDSMPNKSLVSWNAMISDMHRIDILWRQWRCFVVCNGRLSPNYVCGYCSSCDFAVRGS
ncbi:hypothetical protein D5086_005505 [Populus alba]|uniref:Uncharacterized protein n=1 Tax=Populus alba TaxID=43335 RepID=A0ACC4CUQ3_POPAL